MRRLCTMQLEPTWWTWSSYWWDLEPTCTPVTILEKSLSTTQHRRPPPMPASSFMKVTSDHFCQHCQISHSAVFFPLDELNSRLMEMYSSWQVILWTFSSFAGLFWGGCWVPMLQTSWTSWTSPTASTTTSSSVITAESAVLNVLKVWIVLNECIFLVKMG